MESAAVDLQADHVLSCTVEELAGELVDEFRVERLAIAWDQRTADHAETPPDAWKRVGTVVSCHIPFTGDRQLLQCRPSTFTTNPPLARIDRDEIVIDAAARGPNPEEVTAYLDRTIGQVRTYSDWVNAEVDEFNVGLVGNARAMAAARREKVMNDQQLMASLGIPVRRREGTAGTDTTPAIRRKPPVRRSSPSAPGGGPLEPVIPAEEYEHILKVVRNMVLVMERSPRAFVGMKEEDLRQQFLVQLNGQYEGGATGETFNFEGKTDILVRERGRNLFIAECKFWRGAKGLSVAIDQVLGYTTWRDARVAIFLFNRDRQLTSVLEQIAPTVTGRGDFVRSIAYGGETDFRFVVRHKDDLNRELTLTILVFEIPT
jgi:hypothetical protein